ncbi:MAG: AraC family transcriptional regulator [Ectothiorhodospiraceae bacterium]|nr:AraC family transcriptional regulator [Ectothiorhodospiraceae bacterium]
MDVLADVLAVNRFRNSYLGHTTFTPPWGFEIKPAKVATFHIVSRGNCWLIPEGEFEPVRLNQGDVALMAHGAGHELLNQPDTPVSDYEKVANKQLVTSYPATNSTDLFCGVYYFDQDSLHPLLSLLSPVIHLPADQALVDDELQTVIRLLMRENCRSKPGSTTVKKQLMNILFVYIVRAWLDKQPDCQAGWLGALRDSQIGRALVLMHETPQQRWTVNLLAKEVSMSRAGFAKRFSDLVGEAPLTYLTRWRMDQAANLLRESSDAITLIAAKVGYESETAFSKTFRKNRGVPPGQYRLQYINNEE